MIEVGPLQSSEIKGRLRATPHGGRYRTIRALAEDDISVAKYYNSDKTFLLELEPCSGHWEVYD
jgi:hypothetical protein